MLSVLNGEGGRLKEILQLPVVQRGVKGALLSGEPAQGNPSITQSKEEDVNSRRNSNSWIQLTGCSPCNFPEIPPSLLWDCYYQRSFAVHSPFPINPAKTRFK